jgi:hypothetical protein
MRLAFGVFGERPVDTRDREVLSLSGPRLDRADDGHQRSSGLDQGSGPLLNVATDDIEDQIDAADVLQRVVLKVDELMRAEVVCGCRIRGATSGSRGEIAALARHAAYGSDTRGRRVALFELCSIH